MNRTDFETRLKAEGYGDMVDRTMAANELKDEHAHDFDALVLVVEGGMMIVRNGKPELSRPGDICAVAAGTPHTEECGPSGVRYLAGGRRRTC